MFCSYRCRKVSSIPFKWRLLEIALYFVEVQYRRGVSCLLEFVCRWKCIVFNRILFFGIVGQFGLKQPVSPFCGDIQRVLPVCLCRQAERAQNANQYRCSLFHFHCGVLIFADISKTNQSLKGSKIVGDCSAFFYCC